MDHEIEPKKDLFCKNALSRYIECLKLNINVFGNEHGPPMCQYLKEIVEFSQCDIVKYTNKKAENIDDLIKLL